jgi:uncharacterized protein (TIGR02391 family)
MPYAGWTVEADEVLSMSVDELGFRILDDIVQASASGSHSQSENSWMTLAAQGEYAGRRDVLDACSEAWAWLRAKCFVAEDPSQSFGTGWVIVTRAGRTALSRGIDYIRASERLDMDLHPAIEARVRSSFLRGDFEQAVFGAFKEVEVRVRVASGSSQSLLGVPLMQQALGPDKPLADPAMDRGEKVAEMNLFAGFMGLFKNPTSHRSVDYESPTEAAEVVLLADLLLRLLDRRIRDLELD